MKPTIGRIVIYRSRTGDYDVPAIVNSTRGTLNRIGVEAGYVPELTGDEHVHLTVLTPGIPQLDGHAVETADFKVKSKQPISRNVAGTYQEWDIPPAPDSAGKEFGAGGAEWPPPGTWRWPERV